MNVRRAIKAILVVAALAAVCTPRQARAEGYINPWGGIIFADGAKKSLSSFGAAIGDSGSKMGIDVNFGYTPDFTDGGSDKDRVIDLMAGVAAGPQLGRGTQTIRPTVVGGVGLLRTQPGGGDASNDFGFNVGGGILAYFSEKIGIRVDVRYYRTLNGSELGEFDFTRVQFGLLIR